MVQEINRNIDWSDLQHMVRQRWSKLSDDDISQLNGSEDELITVLRKRYGYGKAQAEIEINKWLQDVFSHHASL